MGHECDLIMAHYEDADLGVSFDLPDSPNALTVLTYDSRRIESNDPAIIVLWECVKPILENWQCEILPDPRTPLDRVNGTTALRASQVVKFTAFSGAAWRMGLEAVSKNS